MFIHLLIQLITMKLLLYSFITIYSYVKLLFGIQPGLIRKVPYLAFLLIHSCLIIISIIIMLSLIFVFLMIQIFLFGLDLWLILKLGKDYGGRLLGMDALFESPDEKNSIACLLILNHNENDDYTKQIQELIEKIHDSSPKLSCIVKNCLGFNYYVKNRIKSSDCCLFTQINDKDCLTRDEILDYIKSNYLRNLCNRKNLWHGEIFKQNILWSEKKHQKLLLIAFRHCLGDGPSLIGLINKFATSENQRKLIKFDQKYNSKPAFSLDEAYVYHNMIKPDHDKENLDLKNNERFVAFHDESSIKYVPLIKMIKNKLGVGFTPILIAGLTSSLDKILKKRNKILNNCKFGVVFRPIDENLVSIINGTYDYKDLKNNSTMIVINSPVNMQKRSTAMDRLKSVNEEISKAKNSIDGIFFYSFFKLAHIFPTFLINYLTKSLANITLGVSNVGGTREMKLAGYDVEAAFAFTPELCNTRFILVVFTYNDRFQLTLSTVESTLYTKEEIQEILDDVLPYIGELSDELDIKLN